MESTDKRYYRTSFNVGNVEIWSSNLFSNRESAILQTEDSKDEIVEKVVESSFFYSSKKEAFKMFKNAIKQIKENGSFKKNELDFFILEEPVFEHYNNK